ncbi:hypothetical protein V5799_015952 [Amblyomma americanum]|uniref:Uncharacterized protein n=1 Tax=Amblyomma americanum TaxID=6943 RepID=A0AAQ4F7V3_AMBAM
MESEGHAARLLERYRLGRIRGYGFARHVVRDADADRKQLKKLHALLAKLRHIQENEELVVFMGIRFVIDPEKRQASLNELVQAVSSSLTFLVLITHVTPGHAESTGGLCGGPHRQLDQFVVQQQEPPVHGERDRSSAWQSPDMDSELVEPKITKL